MPPDLKAVQMLLAAEGEETAFSAWTDEELEKEKKRLLAELQTTQKAETTTVEKPKRKVSRRKKTVSTKKK